MGSSSCFLLPHGGYSLIPTVFTTMAWVASIFQDGCDYALIEGPIVQIIVEDDSIPWVEVGFGGYRFPVYNIENDHWDITYRGYCTNFDETRVDLDSAWNASKAFAFLALIFGGGGALFLWFSACCVFSKATWRWAGYEILLAMVFQMLAFLWYGNSLCRYKGSTCSLSWGAKADVVATVFWAIAALAIFCKYPAPRLDSVISQQQQQREITSPEIRVTPTASTTSSSRLQSSPSALAAALPLEGDATATMASRTTVKHNNHRSNQYDDEFSGGKDLTDVEVL